MAKLPPNRLGLYPKPNEVRGTAFTPYVCAALRELPPVVALREQLVDLIGGEHVAAKLGHFATYFGIGLDTVKSWRQMGMPGRERSLQPC